MLEDLERLATRVQLLAELTRQLRDENNDLRLKLGESQAEVRALRNRLAAARTRIEALVDKLPEESDPA